MAAKVNHPDRYKHVPEFLAKSDEPPPRSVNVANINTYLQQSLKAQNL